MSDVLQPGLVATFFYQRFCVWLRHAKTLLLFHVTSPIMFIFSLGFGMTKLMTPEAAATYMTPFCHHSNCG